MKEVEISKGKCVGREQNRAQDRAHFGGKSDKVAGRSKKSQKRRKKGSRVLECGLMESRERCVFQEQVDKYVRCCRDVKEDDWKVSGELVTRRSVVILRTTVSLSDWGEIQLAGH